MSSEDPLLQFAHDHADVNRLVFELRKLLQNVSSESAEHFEESLCDCLMELREQLLLHFAREEEGLFPFIHERAPRMKERVLALETAHDNVCGAVVRMGALVMVDSVGPAPITAENVTHLRAIFDRFEPAYAKHSQVEQALLCELGEHLNEAHRAELRELLRGI